MPMPLAANGAHFLARQIVDPLTLQPDLAAGDAAGRFEETDDGGAGQRFACARFTDHAEHFARRDVERDVVDGDERAPPRRELDTQIANGEGGDCHGAR